MFIKSMAFPAAASCRRALRAASWVPLLALTSTLPRPSSAYAQLPDLATFHDSVARIGNVDQLRGMLAFRSSSNAERSPIALTERGFVALRLYDLTSHVSHSKIAEESFKLAIKQQPGYGWAHFGLGLAYSSKSGKSGWFVVDDVFNNITGNDARTRAHREFTKAVVAQPPVPRAAEVLADNALTKNKRTTLEDARATLTERVYSNADDGAAWFALARVHGELGDMTNAALAMEEAFANGVEGNAVARARASLLLRMHGREEDGARAWFEGVENMTALESAAFIADISALLSKDEIKAWAAMDLEVRRKYLREFWDMRAALGGVSTTERLAEHYRRLATARQRFYRQSKFGAPSQNELRMLPFSQRSDFDDRGEIFIRHGPPDKSIVPRALDRTESWLYRGIDGQDRSFHFFEVSVSKGYSLMHKLPCDASWLEQRAALDARFFRLASRCSAMDMLSVSADLRQIAFEALGTDSDRPNFTKELPFFFDLYTFRGEQGRTSVVAAVAVPFDKLQRNAETYRLDVSLILADTAARRVVRQDDSMRYSTRQVKSDDLFRLHVEIAAPPSKSTVQRVIVSDPSEPGVGQLYGGPFTIPDYSGSKLMLSDVVLAEPVADGRWRRGDVKLALVPTGYFRGGSFNVFYEIYNIATNASYSTEIEIEPVRASGSAKLKGLFGGKGKMTLKFEGVATHARAGVLQELRRVDAAIPPGRYRMRIIVRNLDTSEVARSERTFAVPKD